MTGVEIIALISGFFKFFPEIRNLILLLQKAPVQRQAEIAASINAEAEAMRTTGRPQW